MRLLVLGGFAESLVNFRGALLRACVEQGHEVYACAPDASPALQQQLAAMGVHYRHVPLRRAGLNPVADLVSLLALWRLLRELRPDVFFGYTIKPVIYGTLVAAAAGVPRRFAMITGLGYAFGRQGAKQRLVGGVARGLYRLALARAERVFFQNPDDLELFLDGGLLRGARQAVIINGSGVDIERFQPAELPAGPVFLFIGRLLADKGVREYAAAARLLRQRHPQVRCLLVGWLDENPAAIAAEELDRWVKDGDIEYLGRLDDVRPAIEQCSVYVLPSYREGTPRTVLEAMAMARAVVTSDAPGCRETVSDGDNGLLVPVADVVALSAAMQRFVDEPALASRMGVRGREIAEDKYDVRKVNADIMRTMGL